MVAFGMSLPRRDGACRCVYLGIGLGAADMVDCAEETFSVVADGNSTRLVADNDERPRGAFVVVSATVVSVVEPCNPKVGAGGTYGGSSRQGCLGGEWVF